VNLVPELSPCNGSCIGGSNSHSANHAGPLILSILSGNIDLAKFLIDKGADVNANATGFTALQYAAGSWETEMTGLNGINLTRSKEWAPLAGVPKERKTELINVLLAHGADPNARMTQDPPRYGFSKDIQFGLTLYGATPFFLAAYAADTEVMKLLVAHGADPSIPLETPPVSDDPIKVRTVAALKALGFYKDYGGTTPLMAAAGLGRVIGESPVTEAQALEAVKLCLQLGNKINAADAAGFTALHGAAKSRLDTIVQYLVENGADPDVKDKAGITPLMAAERNEQFAGRQDLTEHTSTGDLLRKLEQARPSNSLEGKQRSSGSISN
jgi:ankyrin repeat protein